MENRETVATIDKGAKRNNPWKGKRTTGPIERQEEFRASIIDTNVSLRENLERNWKNYYFY